MFNLSEYFNGITSFQEEQFNRLLSLYEYWNAQINVISRKDMDAFFIHHVLHALGIAKVHRFEAGASIIDVGTGGGFPGIPLAILFPEVRFHLVDSIGKKIKVVNAVVEGLNLKNVKTCHDRVENFNGKVDFMVCRAVAPMETLVYWSKDKISKKNNHSIPNGMLCLKGGDLTDELENFPKAKIFPLSTYYKQTFFETKKVVYLPLS